MREWTGGREKQKSHLMSHYLVWGAVNGSNYGRNRSRQFTDSVGAEGRDRHRPDFPLLAVKYCETSSMARAMGLTYVNKPRRARFIEHEKLFGCCHVLVKQNKSSLQSGRRSWMRCPLLVNEWMFSRPNLIVELLPVMEVLANRVRLASALWSKTWMVLRGGC